MIKTYECAVIMCYVFIFKWGSGFLTHIKFFTRVKYIITSSTLLILICTHILQEYVTSSIPHLGIMKLIDNPDL